MPQQPPSVHSRAAATVMVAASPRCECIQARCRATPLGHATATAALVCPAAWALPQVADVAKVLVQRLFHRYEVIKVRWRAGRQVGRRA